MKIICEELDTANLTLSKIIIKSQQIVSMYKGSVFKLDRKRRRMAKHLELRCLFGSILQH